MENRNQEIIAQTKKTRKEEQIQKQPSAEYLMKIAGALKVQPEILATLSVIFRLGGITFLFVLFQVAFFILYAKIGLYFPEFWLLQVIMTAGYIFFVYGTIYSAKSKVLRIFKSVVSLLVLLIFLVLYSVISLQFPALRSLRFILLGFTIYYAINCFMQIRLTASPKRAREAKSVLLIITLFFSLNGTIYMISITSRTLELPLQVRPELIFWCASSQLPEEPEILDKCREYRISFMPTLREKDIGNNDYMDSYKLAIAHGVKLYFALGGNSQFFAHLDNAHEFPGIYRNIRAWFQEEGILDSKYVTSFVVDAEPPQDYLESITKTQYQKTLDYGIENYPSKGDIDNASTSLSKFIELVRRDRKTCGIVPGGRYLDGADSDGDISYLTRNLYALPIKWDFSITMLYRTNRLTYNEEDDLPPEFFLHTPGLFYGAIIEGTKFTTSQLSFYQNVALEQRAEFPDAFERHIFVGNLKSEFSKTSYIQNKEYYTDIDICRAFGESKVFIYNLCGFLNNYGWEELDDLHTHLTETKKLTWSYSLYKSVTFLTLYCGLILIDIFVSLEKDLM